MINLTPIICYCRDKSVEGIKNVFLFFSEVSRTVDERPCGLSKVALNSLIQGLAHKYVNEGYRIDVETSGVTVSDMISVCKEDNLICNFNLLGRYYLLMEVAKVAFL